MDGTKRSDNLQYNLLVCWFAWTKENKLKGVLQRVLQRVLQEIIKKNTWNIRPLVNQLIILANQRPREREPNKSGNILTSSQL